MLEVFIIAIYSGGIIMNQKAILNEEKLLNLLKGGATLQEMKQQLGYRDQQLSLKLQSLINKGYLIKRNYHDDKVIFHLLHNLDQLEQNSVLNIRFQHNELNCIFISDTHIGANKEELTELKNIYKYAKENGICHIFHLGDLIEGYSSDFAQTTKYCFDNNFEMIKYLIKIYPRQDTVTTTILLGNHDKYSIATDGMDIRNMISQNRADIHFIGYKNALLSILDKKIALQHPSGKQSIDKYHENCISQYPNQKIDFIFRGHLHESKLFYHDEIPTIHVPPIIKRKKQIGAWQCQFHSFNKEYIDKVILKPLIIDSGVIPITEIVIDCEKNDDKENDEVSRDKYSGLSQSEKFNKRYQLKK